MKKIHDDVFVRIHDQYQHLSKGQKRLADYICEHYDKAVYMTAAKMGQTVGVSESTVVRFASELGYDGYPGMQRALEEVMRVRLTALQRMEASRERMDGDHVMSKVIQSDIANIKETLEMLDQKEFQKAVDAILKARTVYILGVRSSEPLASFLFYYLNLFFDNVRIVNTNSISETFERLMKISPEDVMIGISFPRYSKRTVKAMEFARSRGAEVIAITDSEQSPIASSATCVLKAQSHTISFVDSIVGPMSLVNALIAALSMKRQSQVEQSLADLENIWKEYDVYESLGEEDDTYGRILS